MPQLGVHLASTLPGADALIGQPVANTELHHIVPDAAEAVAGHGGKQMVPVAKEGASLLMSMCD